MVTDLSQKLGRPDTEVQIILPFLIEYKIWISKNPSTVIKIPLCVKEYAKLSTMDLKSNTSCWLAYSEFCQKLFDINVLKKETKIAREALGQKPNFFTCSSTPCSSTLIEYIQVKTELDDKISSYDVSDRLGLLPYSYGIMLEFLADLIGISPQSLGKSVHRKEGFLMKYN